MMEPAEQFPLVMAEAVREAALRAKTAEQKIFDIKILMETFSHSQYRERAIWDVIER